MKKFLFLTATLCILLTVGINAQQKGPLLRKEKKHFRKTKKTGKT